MGQPRVAKPRLSRQPHRRAKGSPSFRKAARRPISGSELCNQRNNVFLRGAMAEPRSDLYDAANENATCSVRCRKSEFPDKSAVMESHCSHTINYVVMCKK